MADVKAESNGHAPAQMGALVDGQANGKLSLSGLKINPARLKIRELVEIERQLDRRVAGDLMTGILGADFMQALLWMALRREHPEITFDAAGEYGFEDIAELVMDDEPVEGDAVDPPPPQSGSEPNDVPPAPRNSKRSRASATSIG